MGSNRDYYDILGLKRGAGENELKAAYRKLVKRYHPDANPDDAGAKEKITEINEAYAVLSDPQKREEYDRHGKAAPGRGQPGRGGGPFSSGFGGGADINVDDLFTGGFGDYFRRGEKRGGPGRGRDISAGVSISFEEAVAGTEKEIKVSFSEQCPSCNATGSRTGDAPGDCAQCNGTGQERVITQSGFGKMTQTRQCPACRGTGKDISESCQKCSGRGYIKTGKRIKVKIPRNTANGQLITIGGMGEPGDRQGTRGDLIVKVTVRPKYGL